MLYILSFFNLIKNLIVKLWSYKSVRVIACLGLAYYLGSGFYDRIMLRASSANFDFLGWDTIIKIPEFNFNPSFVKSGKTSAGVVGAITTLASVFGPGLLFVGIILFLQKVWNGYKAPPLPILYNNEDSEDVIVQDYRMPVLFTKGESWDEDDEVEEGDDS